MVNLRSFWDKLVSAAGRLIYRYPTIARGLFREAELECVGSFDALRYVVTRVTSEDALEAWSGEQVIAIAGQKLKTGLVPWSVAAELEMTPVGRQGGTAVLWFKTRAGQILFFEAGNSMVAVREHDDVDLPGLLECVLRNPEDIIKVTGFCADHAPPAP